VGRKNPIDIKNAGLYGVALVLVTQLFAASVMLFFADQIVGFYTQDAAVAAIASSLLFYAAIFQLSDGIQVSFAGALRGIKDMQFIMYCSIFSFWLLGFIASWYLCFQQQLGAPGLWMGIIVGLTAAALLNGFRFKLKTRIHSQKK
jgi:MATE family multidrug resistance protein